MRIGILTLHSGANYGGTLQCYALYHILHELGHNIEVIDYVPTQKTNLIRRLVYAVTGLRSFTDFRRLISRATSNYTNRTVSPSLIHVFDKFRKSNIILSPRVDETNISTINSRYDVIIVGSDQVWSSFVRNKLIYFGDWSPRFSGRLISYAACATNDKYPIVRKNTIRKLLSQFDAISVRDKKSGEFVQKLIGQFPVIVQDPTILYNFNKINLSDPIIPFPYIFVYILGQEIDGTVKRALDLIKKNLNCELKIIASNIYGDSCAYADDTLTTISPFEWLNLIKHARLVFTDSFHASVFTMKFRTNVISYYVEENRASRLKNLFGGTNLSTFLITKSENVIEALPAIKSKSQYENFHEFDTAASLSFLLDNLK